LTPFLSVLTVVTGALPAGGWLGSDGWTSSDWFRANDALEAYDWQRVLRSAYSAHQTKREREQSKGGEKKRPNPDQP